MSCCFAHTALINNQLS